MASSPSRLLQLPPFEIEFSFRLSPDAQPFFPKFLPPPQPTTPASLSYRSDTGTPPLDRTLPLNQIMCKYGSECRRRYRCRFKHNVGDFERVPLCKFGSQCRRGFYCRFQHNEPTFFSKPKPKPKRKPKTMTKAMRPKLQSQRSQMPRMISMMPIGFQ